jgi:hypothetical protein
MKQNELEPNKSEMSILYKTKVLNKRFNMIIEVNEYVYNKLSNADQEIFVGWYRCKLYDDFGVIRCFKCNRYGHLVKNCNYNQTCGICSGNHSYKQCESNIKKCINCVSANEKLNLDLTTDHEVWNIGCASLNRITEIQKKKYTMFDNK